MEYESTIYPPLLRDKTVLIVGEVSKRKRYVWDVARENGLKVIYIATDKDAIGMSYSTEFIHFDISDHTKDDLNADAILNILKSRGIHIDGCWGFRDDFIVLVALIATKLGLNGIGLEGARITKSKYDTQHYLDRDPDVINTRPFASKSHRICNKGDILSCIKTIELPAIVKTEYGSGGLGVTKVNSTGECLNVFESFQCLYDSTIANDATIQYAFGTRHGRSLVLMEYVNGTEHDINIVMFKGCLLGAFITDNGPTRDGSFFETASSLPTCLPHERRDQLIHAAHLCCIKLGLSSGVFNVEMKMTENGPKLLEINARLPGYCSRDWILQLYGIDLVKHAFLISCGIKPEIPNEFIPNDHMMGVMCVASVHNPTFQNPAKKKQLQRLRYNKEIQYIGIYEESRWGNCKTNLDYLICNISVKERDIETAKRKLLKVCDDLGINRSEYPVSYFLSDFLSFSN